ncbi:MAG: L-threonylcarbamoyladenylate synthase [Raoultibacter sp.]
MTHEDPQLLRAVAALKAGGVAIFPTETVYGIAVAVTCAQSPEALYALKRRDRGKPIAWLVSDASALDTYGADVPDFAYTLARAFWPGPLTLIVQAARAVPPAFCSSGGTIGLRMPDCAISLELLARVGVPLATTSANFAGGEAAKTFNELDSALLESVDAAIDGAIVSSGVASTIIDCTQGYPVMVRQGGISLEAVKALV